LKKLLLYLILLVFAYSANGQKYLRGTVKNEKNAVLQNVKIFVHSSRTIYYSDAYGSFGFIIPSLFDTLTLNFDGYESRTVVVKADQWQNLVLKVLVDNVSKSKQKLISATRGFQQSSRSDWIFGEETYFQLVENEFVTAEKYPDTWFSLNVNKSSYSNVRRFLNMKSTVPPDAVRAEELINYFNLKYNEPEKGEVFKIESQITDCPWNTKEKLLFLNINAKKLDLSKVPSSNFVFLVDVSGSMDREDRLPLIKAAFQMFIKNLRARDTVSIVTYGGMVSVWLQPTSGSEKSKISEAIEQLTAEGDTPGESAIRLAYRLAKSTFIKGGNNRIILATDGDFNVGENSEKALEELISKEKQSGVYLTCLGVGMGNFKDSKLQTLAKKGNGNYFYIDNFAEAEKVLITELTQTLYGVADNAYLSIRFNPATVKQYRLIGFDNKKEAIDGNNSNGLEGGEVGSGNSVMAIFQILPAENTSQANLGNITLQYMRCNDKADHQVLYDVKNNYLSLEAVSPDLKFAAAVTMFALKLKNSRYMNNNIPWKTIAELAASSADKSNFLQQEFIGLVHKADKIYDVRKKRKTS
jgi:Ca-activated chloride channel homolog